MERNFVFSNYTITIDPLKWPENSLPRESWMGDKDITEYIIKGQFEIETIKLIETIVKRDTNDSKLCPYSVDWKNLKNAMDYLNIPSGVDYIYPLFLTQTDRKKIFEDSEEKIMEISVDEVKCHRVENSEYDFVQLTNKKDLCLLRSQNAKAMEILTELKDIPGLFVMGGFPIAKFYTDIGRYPNRNVSYEHYKQWSDLDIFAYGPNSLEHIKEGIRRCLNMSESHNVNFRTKCLIDIYYTCKNEFDNLWTSINIQFVLFKLDNIPDILKMVDIDCAGLVFEISNPDVFYGFRRTYLSLISETNIVNPKYYTNRYVSRLLKYSKRGFKIAIPGFNMDNAQLSPDMLKLMFQRRRGRTSLLLRDMELTGLNSLISYSLFPECSEDACSELDSNNKNYHNGDNTCDYAIWSLKHNIYSEIKTPFVIGDIFNETPGTFKWRHERHHDWIAYEPLYPKIELIDIHFQEKMETPFYEQYYSTMLHICWCGKCCILL